MSRRLRSGELLAVDPSAIARNADGFFMLLGNPPPANTRVGTVEIVHIRDALEHHMCPYSDSYEAILQRVGCAMRGETEPEGQSEGTFHKEPDGDEEGGEKPSAVILDIDSPGGVVAGLNETVLALQAMAKECKVPLVAYVNELAASAAYALCCACSEVVCPESGIVGSVGVISTMVSQADADKKMGIDVVLITSGARKADGHVHAKITKEAIAAERKRLDQSAMAFFRMVQKARGMSVKKIRGLEAGIFQGPEAVEIGLADEVIGLAEAISALSEEPTPTPSPSADGNETDRRALDTTPGTGSKLTHRVRITQRPEGNGEMLKLKALIKKTEAAIAAEKDPEKLVPLMMSLEAYKKTEKHIEHTKSESDDEPAGDDDDDKKDDEDDEDEDDEKKASAAKKSEEEAKAKKSEEEAKAASAAKKKDEEDEDEDEEEDEKKSASAVVAAASAAFPGKKGRALVGALSAVPEMQEQLADLRKRVSKLQGTGRKAQRETIIANAVATRRITKPMAAKLGKMKLEAVQSALELFSGPIVTTDEDALHAPDQNRSVTTASGLSAEAMEAIDLAVKGSGMTGDKGESLRQAMITNAKKSAAEMNGAPGRF